MSKDSSKLEFEVLAEKKYPYSIRKPSKLSDGSGRFSIRKKSPHDPDSETPELTLRISQDGRTIKDTKL